MGEQEGLRLGFGTWNIKAPWGRRDWEKTIEFVRSVPWNVLALQEVQSHAFERLCDADPELFDVATTSDFGGGTSARRALRCVLLTRRPFSLTQRTLIPGLPRVERGLAAIVTADSLHIGVASWHAPYAAGGNRLKKMQAYSAIHSWLATVAHPFVFGLDTNSWIDPPRVHAPVPGEPDYEERRFLAESAEHGLRDAFRVWLESRPEEMERIARSAQHGPLAVTYNCGGTPSRLVRFDRIFISPQTVEVLDVQHHYARALAAGSDHALVYAELLVNCR